MSLYYMYMYLILWNQVDILQKYFKKDHVHMRLWTRFYGIHVYEKEQVVCKCIIIIMYLILYLYHSMRKQS